MSLGSDFISGFEATRSIKEKRAERALRQELLEKELANRKAQQEAQLLADAQRQFSDQTFRAGEGERDRTFRRGERVGSQEFTGAEREKDRGYGTREREATQTFQGGENEKTRAQQKLLSDAQLLADAERLKQSGSQFDAKLGWEKDPANPDNVNKMAHARYLDPEGAPSAPPLPNAKAALENSRKATPPPAAAIEMLRANPQTAPQFRAKYGVDPEQYLKR